VLVSFLALALLVIGVQAAGHKAGWGIQSATPIPGGHDDDGHADRVEPIRVFEVALGGRAMGAAASASAKEGAAGAFFNGLLATVLATSCTAPFLGAAVGFALAPGQRAG